jgi:hypothetical protein
VRIAIGIDDDRGLVCFQVGPPASGWITLTPERANAFGELLR